MTAEESAQSEFEVVKSAHVWPCIAARAGNVLLPLVQQRHHADRALADWLTGPRDSIFE